MMPPSGARRPERAVLDALRVASSKRASTRRRRRRGPRRAGAAPAQSHRIRERDPRSAGARRRRRGAAAARRVERRVRQHRRRAERVAVADPGLRVRGDEDQPARGRRPHADADAGHLSRSRRAGAGSPHRGPAARHARRHAGPAHVSARRRIRVQRHRRRSAAGGRGGAAVDVTLDGEKIAVDELRAASAINVTAGPHTIGAALVDRAARGRRRRAYLGLPHRLGVHARRRRADGRHHRPVQATGAGDTPSRRRIFVCRPAGGRAKKRRARARSSTTLARRAYRRAAARRRSRDADGVLSAGPQRRATSRPASSRRWRACSSRPRSCTASKRSPQASRPGATYRISDLELASRLSFFLWSSIPGRRTARCRRARAGCAIRRCSSSR